MKLFTKQWVWIGVDLGQRRDSSAIAVVERVWEQSTPREFVETGRDGQWWFHVRTLERLRLDTEYPDVVERVRTIADRPQVKKEGRTVVVDGTGVGVAVVDLLRRAKLGCMIVPIVITGGGQSSTALRGGYESVSRSELLTAMQVLAQQGRIRIASGTQGSEVLRRELLGLRLSSSKGTNEHDDLAIAVALALWKARNGALIETKTHA